MDCLQELLAKFLRDHPKEVLGDSLEELLKKPIVLEKFLVKGKGGIDNVFF